MSCVIGSRGSPLSDLQGNSSTKCCALGPPVTSNPMAPNNLPRVPSFSFPSRLSSPGMNTTDRDALERAMQTARRDPSRARQLDAKLQDDPWSEVSQFAAYCCQIHALHLKPWQSPPCSVDEDDPDEHDNKTTQKLLRLMLANGVSRFDPDPLAALKRRKRKKE
jgi:hypothetical protein